jgi:hypothetical protein
MEKTAVESIIIDLDNECKERGMFVNWDMYLAKEKEQSHNYADFCVRCDRDQMKLLDFNDYIKIYTNGL